MMAWFEESFGQRYLDLYSHRDETEARHVIKLIQRAASPLRLDRLRILDLACGAGRYSHILAAQGHFVAGADLSAKLLESATRRAGHETDGGQAVFIRADMRAVPFKGVFDLAICMFTSFGYFETDEQNAAVLIELSGSLRSGGAYLLDFLNRPRVISCLKQEDSFVKDGIKVRQRRWITADGLRVEKETLVQTEYGGRECYHESVRMFSRGEMLEMLELAGLPAENVFGGYDMPEHGDDSERLIITGRKK
jgi:SAM-dependent methyltransferase